MNMEYATISTSSFPVIEVNFNKIEATEENFDHYLLNILDIYNKYENFVIIFNAKQTLYLPSHFREKQADWMKRNREIIKKKCLGTAFYVPNILNNAILNCIFVIAKPTVQYLVTTDYCKAQEWAWKIVEKYDNNFGIHI